MRGGRLWVLVLLGGCDQLFELREVREAERPDAAVVSGATGCPDVFHGDRYFYDPTPRTWLAAKAACAVLDTNPNDQIHTHLAIITNGEELAQLPLLPPMDPWVGLTDLRASGVFEWITLEPTASPPWESGDPDETSPACGAIDDDSRLLHDKLCSSERDMLCECDEYPEGPT